MFNRNLYRPKLRRMLLGILLAAWSVLGLGGVSAAQDDAAVLTTYLNAVADMNRGFLVTDPNLTEDVTYQLGTAVEALEINRAAYQGRLDTLNSLEVPGEVAEIHADYVALLVTALAAYDAAIAEADPLAAAEAASGYLYRTPEYGYVFDEENALVCALKPYAEANGIADFPSLFCDSAALGTPVDAGETVGSPDAPVNAVNILHDVDCGGRCPRVRYTVSTIYASAGEPILITFDNRNPLPFLFNLAIYRGYEPGQRLDAANLIVSTNAGGPRVHRVALNLEPGVYTFADNVHPNALQGQLIVVE